LAVAKGHDTDLFQAGHLGVQVFDPEGHVIDLTRL
jgi:hypothetical protein